MGKAPGMERMTRREPWQRECPGRSGQCRKVREAPRRQARLEAGLALHAGGPGRGGDVPFGEQSGWLGPRWLSLRAPTSRREILGSRLSRPQPCPPRPEPPPTSPYSTPRKAGHNHTALSRGQRCQAQHRAQPKPPDPCDLSPRGSAGAPSYPAHPWPVFAPEPHGGVQWGPSLPRRQGKAPRPVDRVRGQAASHRARGGRARAYLSMHVEEWAQGWPRGCVEEGDLGETPCTPSFL